MEDCEEGENSAVPEQLVIDTLFELRQQFGAVSSETQIIQGQWQHAGTLHRDELMRLFCRCCGQRGKP